MPPKLGEYVLTKPIGKGAMGQVWLAKQESLDRLVAVKILPKEFATDSSFRARFEREAKIAASMIHPNVIQIYSYGIEQNVPYFAMEYVEGQDLGARIRKGQKFTIRESVKIVADVARALEVAHEKGLVHRDIKPGNIMISKKGIVKVMDFGLAKAASVQSAISQPGLVMGTPSYMSPEQGMGQELDVRSDIYALGVVLYKLLTGEVPFVADKATAVIFMHIYEKPQPIRSHNPEVPAELIAIVDKMMAKKPEDRYNDPSVLVSDLEAFLSGAASSLSIKSPRRSEEPQRTESISGSSEKTGRTEPIVRPEDPTVGTTKPNYQNQMTEVTESIAGHREPTVMQTQGGPTASQYARTEDMQLEFLEDLMQGDNVGANSGAKEAMEKSPGLRDRYSRQLFVHSLIRSYVDSQDRVSSGRRIMKVLSVVGLDQKKREAPVGYTITEPRAPVKSRGPMLYYAVAGFLVLAVFAGFMLFMIPSSLPAGEKTIEAVREKTYNDNDRIYDLSVAIYDTGVRKVLAGKLHVRGPDKWVALYRGGSIAMGSNGESGWINPSSGRHIVLEDDRKYLQRFGSLEPELPRLSMEEILPRHGWFYFSVIGENSLEKYPDRKLVQVKATSVPGRSGSPIDEGSYWIDKETGELVYANLSLQPGDMAAGPRTVEIRLIEKKEHSPYFYHYENHNYSGKGIYIPSADRDGGLEKKPERKQSPGYGDNPW